MCAELGKGIELTSLLSRGTGSHCSAARGKAKLSDGKEELCYEMFCDGCAVCAMYGKGFDKRRGARAQMRIESRRHG